MTDDLKLLDELEALEKKATKGPWGVRDDHPNRACLRVYPTAHEFSQESVADCYSAPGDRMVEDLSGKWIDDPERVANASLIPAARNALPLLIRLARRGLAAGEVVEAANEVVESAYQARMDMQDWGSREDGIPAEYSDNWERLREFGKKYKAALARLAAKEGA